MTRSPLPAQACSQREGLWWWCVKVRAELRPRAKADDPASEVRTTKKMLKLLGDKYTQVRHTHQ